VRIRIDVDAWSHQTQWAEEQFGDWAAEGGINGVSVRRAPDATKDSWSHNVWDLDVQVGGYVFPVIAHYGTGDSFGHQSGGEYQIIKVCETVEEADAVKRLCETRGLAVEAWERAAWRLQGLEREKARAKVAEGLSIPGVGNFYPRWEGYFESLNEIKVWTCRVEA